jgi:hypothetical protein
MIQRIPLLVAALLSLASLRSFPLEASDLVGSAAPYFRVQSGDDKEMTLDMIKGKVTTIFYENKDIIGANKRLKDELNKLYLEQTKSVKAGFVRLPVIDCSDATWLFRWMWKSKLREHSKKEGMAIYCDWEGKMAFDYKMKSDVSNVVVIDKKGSIKFFTAGEVKDHDIDGVKQLLRALSTE